MEDFIDGFFDWCFDHWKGLCISFCLMVAVAIAAPTLFYYHGANAGVTRTCKVEDKESISKDSGHEYRVYTDCGNFVVQDEFWAGNFHASDTYREMKEGKTYLIKTRGWRVPFLSMFPNIYSVEKA